MEYQLVFDAAREGYRHWWPSLAGLLLAGLGLGLQRMQRSDHGFYRSLHWRPNNEPFKRAFPWVFIGFGSLVAAMSFASTFGDYQRVAGALRTGRFVVVEGKVANFVPNAETFTVGQHRYSYSDHLTTAGYNRTHSNGGLVREGAQVRIADVEGTIARLEIAAP